MNLNLIEENFNLLYDEINKKYYADLSKLREQVRREKNIRFLIWVIYAAITIFAFYIMSVIADNLSINLLVISILLISVFIIGGPIFITVYFNKKSDNFYKMYREKVLSYILNNINDDWEYYSTNKTYFLNRNMTDYYTAKFPKEAGGIQSSYGMKNKVNGNISESMLFEIYEGGEYGTGSPNYKGIYFSILNNNCIQKDIYIRSKAWDGLFKGKLPFPKLDINTNNYNIYSENIYVIPNGLVELIDKFYELTDIRCDLSISKNKIQIRFDTYSKNRNTDNVYKNENKEEIFDKHLLYKTYFELVQINEFIKELCDLLSN